MSELWKDPTTRTLIIVGIVIVAIIVILLIVNSLTTSSGSTAKCSSDTDCNDPALPVCDKGNCVQCAFDADCAGTLVCTDNVCQPPPYICKCPSMPTVAVESWTDNGGGNTIIFNHIDGLIYFFSGYVNGENDLYIETYDPATGLTNMIMNGNVLGGGIAGKITALTWYNPLSAFVGVTTVGDVFSISPPFTSATALRLAEEGDPGHRGIAVMASGRVFATGIEDDPSLYEFNTTSWTRSSVATLTDYEGVIYVGAGLAYNPRDGKLYISYINAGEYSGVGTVNISTGVITPTCLEDSNHQGFYADVAVDPYGRLWFQSGSNQSASLSYLEASPCESQTLPNAAAI